VIGVREKAFILTPVSVIDNIGKETKRNDEGHHQHKEHLPRSLKTKYSTSEAMVPQPEPDN
jgi:hypothetical protein